jgi:hypothetical protein
LGEPGELPLLCGEVWGGSGLMTSNKKTLMKHQHFAMLFQLQILYSVKLHGYKIINGDQASIKSGAVMAYFKVLSWQGPSVSTVGNQVYSITTRG